VFKTNFIYVPSFKPSVTDFSDDFLEKHKINSIIFKCIKVVILKKYIITKFVNLD